MSCMCGVNVNGDILGKKEGSAGLWLSWTSPEMSVSTQSQKLPSKEGSIFKKIVVRQLVMLQT